MIREIRHHGGKNETAPSGTLLAFDYGAWRIGVAVGESMLGSARQLTTLVAPNAHQIDWQAIAALIEEWKPCAIVVGWPILDDGTPYPVAEFAERFARRLHGRYELPVFLVDERLSSENAELRLMADPAKRKAYRRAPERLDAEAAAVILETYFSQADQAAQ